MDRPIASPTYLAVGYRESGQTLRAQVQHMVHQAARLMNFFCSFPADQTSWSVSCKKGPMAPQGGALTRYPGTCLRTENHYTVYVRRPERQRLLYVLSTRRDDHASLALLAFLLLLRTLSFLASQRRWKNILPVALLDSFTCGRPTIIPRHPLPLT